MADKNQDLTAELNEKITAQEAEINQLKHDADAAKAELDQCKGNLHVSEDKVAELNSLLVEANKTIEAQKTQLADLTAEIEPLRKMKADADATAIQAEVNSYFEAIKNENGFTEAEINSLKEDYVDKCDLDGLKAKEQELCVKKIKEMRKTPAAEKTEVNSHSDGENLFFSTRIEQTEVNNEQEKDGSDLFK